MSLGWKESPWRTVAEFLCRDFTDANKSKGVGIVKLKGMVGFTLSSLAFLFSSMPTAGAVTYRVTCSGDITRALQGAITGASDGDVVRIGSGSCMASGPIQWTDKNISVIGAGIDATTIIAGNNDVFDVAMTTGSAGASSAGTPVSENIMARIRHDAHREHNLCSHLSILRKSQWPHHGLADRPR